MANLKEQSTYRSCSRRTTTTIWITINNTTQSQLSCCTHNTISTTMERWTKSNGMTLQGIFLISPHHSTRNQLPTPKLIRWSCDREMMVLILSLREEYNNMSIERQVRVELAREKSERLQKNDQGDDSRKSKKDLDSGSSPYVSKMANRILEKIQLLDYNKSTPNELQRQFKGILRSHIAFQDIFPVDRSEIGRQLMKDGLFHEMWSKVCQKMEKIDINGRYYWMFYERLNRNQTCFERAYNHNDSREEIATPVQKAPVAKAVYEDSDSLTRLTVRKPKKELVAEKSISLNLSSKENASIDELNQSENKQHGRLKLCGKIQTNQRRLNAELVCYFMGIAKCYDLVEIQIDKILEFYHHQDKELLIIQAFEPSFCEEIGKKVIKCEPKILMCMYGYVSFSQLLRIKQQYRKVDGFIIYDGLVRLDLWLQRNGFSTSIS